MMIPIPHHVNEVAEAFLILEQQDFHTDGSPRTMKAQKLVKLCYLAHAEHLVMSDKPLFHNAIESWEYGVMIPDLYQSVKRYRSETIKREVNEEYSDDLYRLAHSLRNFFDNYKMMTANELSSLTGEPRFTWFNRTSNDRVLSNYDIKNHYEFDVIKYYDRPENTYVGDWRT